MLIQSEMIEWYVAELIRFRKGVHGNERKVKQERNDSVSDLLSGW